MGHDEHRSSTDGTALVLALLVALLLIGALVFGTFFWVRTVSQQRAMVERDRALMAEAAARQAQQQMARAKAMPARAASTASDQTTSFDGATLTLRLDDAGTLRADDQPLSLEDLKQRLEQDIASVVVHADGDCPFRVVAEVTDVCKAAGVGDVQLKRVD